MRLHREDESKLKSDKGDGALFLALVVNHINEIYSSSVERKFISLVV